MGHGAWSSDVYSSRTTTKIDSGGTFGYDRSAKAAGEYVPHADLDPFKVIKDGIIESRDSVDHPNSVPIIIGVDQTGSMGEVPRIFQRKMKGIFDLLMLRGYIEDPQIAIGAYGDTHCDPIRSTVQFSNFESDNRIDDALDNLLIMGYGGGNGGETLTGLWYMMDKVRSDAWEKRGKKGYAFFVADEIALDLLPEHVLGFAGDGQPTSPLTAVELAAKIQEQWDVYILLIDNMAAKIQGSEAFYKNLFGQTNVLVLENNDTVAETIALAIGIGEGTVDIEDAEDDLKATGSSEIAVRSSIKTIRNSGLSDLARKNNVAAVNISTNLSEDDGVERL